MFIRKGEKMKSKPRSSAKPRPSEGLGESADKSAFAKATADKSTSRSKVGMTSIGKQDKAGAHPVRNSTIPNPNTSGQKGKISNGAQIIVDSLIEEGVDTMFGYIGGVVLPLFDRLYDAPIRFINPRHE